MNSFHFRGEWKYCASCPLHTIPLRTILFTEGGSSLEKSNKIIPDLVIRAPHLSASKGADCDLDGADHIVDFEAPQGLSHYDNTSTIPGATLEKGQKAVNKKYHDRTMVLDLELHGTQEDQRGPIKSKLNEYGHCGRVLAPVIGQYGGASSDLSLILDLVAREMAPGKHTASYNIGFSEAKALFRQKLTRKRRHAIPWGWATLILDRLKAFIVVPSSAGGNAETLLLSCTLRARRSVTLWTATITSMATRACAPDTFLWFSLRCFAFLLYLLAF